ncbi:MBL fold metallo-hydrolase [Mangrovicella endophytica]|uniref:MBL fold metallo-hydrolase n=1 Tax=Mangrovicella endophytica TaxID=2066697 RepID=UPI000C9E392E|nr:MBL fold metallo-hydrolase [Mangrovicella endophytica]
MTPRFRRRRFYKGPPSDHFDGHRFFNPDGELPKGLGAVLRWRLEGKRQPWPESFPSRYEQDRPPARVGGDRLRLVCVGHASLLLQTGGLNILFDPVWSERCSPFPNLGPKRHQPPGIAFDDLPPIDVVLVTHSHYDHLDQPTLEQLQRRHRPRFIVPLGVDTLLRGFSGGITAEAYDWGDRVRLGDEVAVTLDPAHHWSARGVFDRRLTLWTTFVLETPAGLVYCSGDTGFFGGVNYRAAFERFGAPKLAVLPIGAYLPRFFMHPQHQDPDEAVRGARFLGAELTIGSHWGCWQLTDEAADDPLRLLDAALKRWDVPAERFQAGWPGMVVELPATFETPPLQPLTATPETTRPTPEALFV